MNRDKAALPYDGRSQLDRAFDLAGRHSERGFVSVRESQSREPTRAQHPLIIDAVGGEGPIVGIRSALAAFPGVAWLVLACDLPFLSDAALDLLLHQRDPTLLATAYRSAHDGLPEPLCAIWEPAAGSALADYQDGGGRCPRKFLMTHAVKIVEPVDLRALDNVNTPAEYEAACGAIGPGPNTAVLRLTVQYFAVMREQAGHSQDTVETRADTAAALYGELQRRHGFTLSQERLKVAVNGDFADWTRPLRSGDSIVFIPPVAGG